MSLPSRESELRYKNSEFFSYFSSVAPSQNVTFHEPTTVDKYPTSRFDRQDIG